MTRRVVGRAELRKILDLHAQAVEGAVGGVRANLDHTDLAYAKLRGADLRGATLKGARLRFADLRGANLRRADLRGADLLGANIEGVFFRETKLRGADLRCATFGYGVTWEVYLAEVVPALLQAGGRALDEVATKERWACRSWRNCPISAAFGCASFRDVPALYRGEAGRFIELFDAGLIPLPSLRREP